MKQTSLYKLSIAAYSFTQLHNFTSVADKVPPNNKHAAQLLGNGPK
jgi:hypothetical protein